MNETNSKTLINLLNTHKLHSHLIGASDKFGNLRIKLALYVYLQRNCCPVEPRSFEGKGKLPSGSVPSEATNRTRAKKN